MRSRKQLLPDVISGQDLVKLPLSAKAREAAKLMDRHHISSVLVVDKEDKLQGIFTVRDVARRIVGGDLDPDQTPLSKVMTKNPKCVSAKAAPHAALRIMQDGGFRHLPVTDDGSTEGQLVGIVSRRSFFPEEEALLKFEEHLWEHMR